MINNEIRLADDVDELLQTIEDRENDLAKVILAVLMLGSKETASDAAENRIIAEVLPAEAARISKEDKIMARCLKSNVSKPEEQK